MAAFERQGTLSFEQQMLRLIAPGFPDWLSSMGEEGALAYVRTTVASAARQGIVTGPAIGVLVLLKLEFGETFELSPEREWARNILEHPLLPGDIKVKQIAKRLVSGAAGRRIIRRPTIR